MKWKKILTLGLCLMLAGCGQPAAEQKGEEKEMQVQDQEASAAQSETSGEETTAGEEATVSGTGSEATKQKDDKKDSEKVEMTEKKNMTDPYDRAAYLADQIYASAQTNTLVSPISLDMALGLAAEGASGDTARELYDYLGRQDYADWAKGYLDFAQSLESSDEPENSGEEVIYDSYRYSFRYELANSIWVRKSDVLNPQYQKLVSEKFRAEAANVDFMGEPQKTADRINEWCDEHTHGMIPKMVEPDMFSADLAAILMNSVYFESPWTDKWGLAEHEFTNLAGEKTTQEMLVDTVSAYYENENAVAFSKNYYNGFSFIGILPKEEGDFRISELDLKSLLESVSYEYDVKAIAPKLDFETATKQKEIVNILKDQGLCKVFDPGSAQFDKLVDGQELHIDDILQKCRIEMDEEGTRAAAVTAIMMRLNSAIMEKKSKEVYLDRPFAFLIYDSTNDQILFVGKVTEL